MKLLGLIFLTLLAFAVGRKLRKTVDPKQNTAYGYLANIGLPLANRIREAEQQCEKLNSKKNPNAVCKIVRGFAARLGDFPYQAGLLVEFVGGQSVCGGSLISPKRVLTAGHCWADGVHQARRMTVVLGSVKLFSGGTRLRTSHVVVHQRWDPQVIINDIAMVNLPNAVQYSNIISPIALPARGDNNNLVGATVTASGFGLKGDADAISERTYLSHVNLEVIRNSQCQRWFPFVGASIICTNGATLKNICSGDSGGPIAVTVQNKRVLVGITSFGSQRCEDGSPGGFTRVSFYMDWIQRLL
ncbi:collagenase-like [Anticarsia gemmatalis]|uniref:collagenase-like n=1 Tax=Anticarsia gemmatalis TaxID=129554 RepID=UPI003F76B8A8